MTKAGLTLSVGKTEAVILTRKRGYSLPELMIKGTRIEIKDKIKYLGLELHRVFSFKKHVEMAAAKVQTTFLAECMRFGEKQAEISVHGSGEQTRHRYGLSL